MSRWRALLEREDEFRRPRSFTVAEGVELPSPGDALLVGTEGDAIRVTAVEPSLRTCWWVKWPEDLPPAGARRWEFLSSGAKPSSGPQPHVEDVGFERTVSFP